MATRRSRRQNVPGVPGHATGPHTASNNARTGLAPTRRRASVSPDTLGRARANPSSPATSLPHTCRYPDFSNNANANTK